MIDAKRLLDLLVGASSRPGPGGQGGSQGSFLQSAIEAFGRGGQGGLGGMVGQVLGQAGGGLREMAQRANEATGGVGAQVDRGMGQAVREATGGQSGADLARKAKDFMDRNPGLAEAALMSVAGILLGSRQGRGIARSVAGLGGLAVVTGLAYKAFQNHQAGKPLLDAGQGGEAGGGTANAPARGAAATASLPGPAAFDPAQASEDDALLFARAMVAAAAADGRMDDAERARIMAALAQAGIDAAATGWLDRELSQPATIEELSDPVRTPEKAAQVYAAARVAVDPDTIQEREFLRQLAEALDLDPQLKAHIDEAAAGVRAEG